MTMVLPDAKEDAKSDIQDTLSTRPFPAWRRLGLKLKFANEYTDLSTRLDSITATTSRTECQSNSHLREVMQETASEPVLKKQRRLLAEGQDKSILFSRRSPPMLRAESKVVKKTVAFTSDTKSEDGDSSKALIAGWEARYDQNPVLADRSAENQLSRQKTRPKISKTEPYANKPHAALEYLKQFNQARESWKFSKNREIWILRHLFSIEDIPPDYDIILWQYLQGLKSAAALTRIRQKAEEVVRKDQDQQIEYIVPTHPDSSNSQAEAVPTDMGDPIRRRACYEDLIARYKAKLETQLDEVMDERMDWVSPERLAKRLRAEIILRAIGVSLSDGQSLPRNDASVSLHGAGTDDQRDVKGGVMVAINRRRKKNRTSVIELSSSSDGSSESSDSSSESQSVNGDIKGAGQKCIPELSRHHQPITLQTPHAI